ncbi:MAG: protein kinase [Myxococcales bacterium]
MGAYRLVRKLATGGMAEVFLGKVVGLDGFEKPVAVKRILPHLGEDPVFVSLFLQEAKLTVTLQHANVVQVFDLGALKGQYYMVLEFIDGDNLRSLLTACQQRRVAVGLREACFITQQVAEGLAYAHERKDPQGRPLNIVHRDVNPTNVMINRTGEVKLADFGIAKASTSQSTTGSGTLKAKTGYMAPEQAAGEEPDQRSDVFLLGLLLYELLAGQRLFQETELLKSVKQIAFFDPKAMQLLPGVPPALWDILMRALCPHASARTPSARELSNQLTGFLFDNRLRVSPQDIAAFFARAAPDFRSALEVQGDEDYEEIRLTSSAEPRHSEHTPTPTPSRSLVSAVAPGRPQPSFPSPRPAAESSSPLLRLPQFVDTGGAQSIKIDRRSQRVVLALMSGGQLAQDKLPEVASLQATLDCDFLTALQRSGLVAEQDLMQAQAEVLRVPYVGLSRLESMPVPKDAVRLVNRTQAERLGVVPIAVRGPQLFVATNDATNLRALDELKLISGKTVITPILATSEGLERARQRFYGAWSTSGSLDLELGSAPAPGRSPPSRPGGPAPARADSPPLDPPQAAAVLPVADADAGTSRVQQRLLTSLFAMAGPPLAQAPAFVTLAQRLSERLGASPLELERVAAAAAALAVASRLEGREPFAIPGIATLRAVLGPSFEDIADLVDPVLAPTLPADLGPGPSGLATALRFVALAHGPTPGFEEAKGAIGALHAEVPAAALGALGDELSDRYGSAPGAKKPRVLVALKDAGLLADVSRLLTNQGFASVSVRSRAEIAQQLRSGSATLLAEPSFSGLGTPEAIFELRNDPDPKLTDMPIVLVATPAETPLAHLGIEAGADDVFSLPFNEAVVVEKLKKLAQRASA